MKRWEIRIDCKLLDEQIDILCNLLETQDQATIDAVDGVICMLSGICYALKTGKEIHIEEAEEE